MNTLELFLRNHAIVHGLEVGEPEDQFSLEYNCLQGLTDEHLRIRPGAGILSRGSSGTSHGLKTSPSTSWSPMTGKSSTEAIGRSTSTSPDATLGPG